MTDTQHSEPFDNSVVWLNGKTLHARDANLPLWDLGLQGIAVTEMLRTFQHEPFRLKDHLDRLEQSLKLTAIDCPVPREDLEFAIKEVAYENAGSIDSLADLGIVAFVTAGGNPTYLGHNNAPPTCCVHSFRLPFSQWADEFREGMHLVIPEVRQLRQQDMDARIKSRSRMHWHLANVAARKVHSGARALLLGEDGHVTETSSANFFIVQDDVILTPADNVLEGVSCKVVSELALVLGLKLERRPLTLGDVTDAEEAFVSSTPWCLMPVTRIQDGPVGNGLPGPVFFELLNAWSELTGVDIVNQISGLT